MKRLEEEKRERRGEISRVDKKERLGRDERKAE